MSIYDKSSLVLIPSGTKTGKVYSQKPVSGDGDFTFTRASAATRVNADGNIEKETQNLLLQGNNFTNGWSQNLTSVTSGQSGYDGTNDAWLLTATSAFGNIARPATSTGVLTLSLYMKAGDLSWGRLRFDNNSSGDINVWVNLSTGALGNDNSIAAYTENAGNGWWRVVCQTNTTDLNNIRFYPADGSGSNSTAGYIYIQDAQLEQGLVARDYIETTTAAVYGGITDNTPRLDYTDSSCPALLLEPLRTNAFNHSEYSAAIEYNNVNSITNNAAISPEGVQNALEIDADGNDIADSYRNAGSGVVATFSVFAKAGTGDTITLNPSSTGSNATATYDLTNGTISSAGYGQYIDSDIENYGNGWWRCSITFTTGTGAYINRTRFVDTGTYQLYGFQLEAGSYATSYIPTYGSSVSRVADSCSKTGISSLLNDSEGTLFLETKGISDGGDSRRFTISSGSISNRVSLEYDESAGRIKAFMSTGGTTTGALDESGHTQTDTHKIAITYTSSAFKIFIDGALEGTDSSLIGTPVGLNQIEFKSGAGNNPMEGFIKQALVFKTALTDQEAIDLTTI